MPSRARCTSACMARPSAVARQQADQIFNLSLTRTATRTLLAPGTRGVIGIGRGKTPTLGIVCMRELEIRDFRPEDYFEVVAQAKRVLATLTKKQRKRLEQNVELLGDGGTDLGADLLKRRSRT